MKIEINTSAENFESANCIMNFAVEIFRDHPSLMNRYQINEVNLARTEKFRAASVKGFKKVAYEKLF